MAVFTTDLSDFLIPKISDYAPGFGTMKESGGLTTKEVSENIMYPLLAQRGFSVTESSQTSSTVARNSKFIVKEAGITLTVGDGIDGVTVDIYNKSGGSANVVINGETIELPGGRSQNWEWINGQWKKTGVYDELVVDNDLTVNGNIVCGGKVYGAVWN